MNKKVVVYIVIIIVILIAVFFSQQTYSREIISKVLSNISKYAGASLTGALNPDPIDTNLPTTESIESTESNNSYKLTESAYNSSNTNNDKTKGVGSYITSHVSPIISNFSENITEGLKNGGEIITNSINTVKEKITEEIPKKIENYFSGIKDAVQGKNNDNCTTTPTN